MADPAGTLVMEQNLVWYRRLLILASAYVWLPTAFLFFIAEFGLGDALVLQAVYYLAVVVFEVPSGWFSDQFGRVPTLRVQAVAWIGAHTVFAIADDLSAVALAQVLLAFGFALQSGTDVTFHFDSLEAIGREAEFEERESSARRAALVVLTASSVLGGALGVVDLRLPFVVAAVVAVVHLAVSTQLREPPRSARARAGFRRDLSAVVQLLRRPLLAWIGLYVIAQVVAEHLASEIAAPYLAAVLGEDLAELDRAPLLNGAIVGGVALLGAVVVGWTPALRRSLGLVGALVALAVVPTVIVVAMAVATSWVVVVVLFARNVQSTMAPVLITSAVGGEVDQRRRATFLSLTSLGGRLTYGLVLLGLSRLDDLDATLRWSAVIAVVALVAVVIPARPVADRSPRRL